MIDDSGITDIIADNPADIRIEGTTIHTGTEATVYDMAGRVILTGTGTLQLPAPGIYIVAAPSRNPQKAIIQ